MKKSNVKEQFRFLLEEGEKAIYTQRFADFGKYKRAVFFLAGTALILSDCFFLGASVVLTFFDRLKWFLVAMFLLKVAVDVIVLGLWLSSINDRSKRNENTFFIKTDKKFIIAGERDGEVFFSLFPLDCHIEEKTVFNYRKISFKTEKQEQTFYLKATNQKLFDFEKETKQE